MAKLAVFASGTGSNFAALARAIDEKSSHEIELLVCDREGAPVLERAAEMEVPTMLVSYRGVPREVVEKKIADLGKSYNNPIELAVDREVQLLVTSMVNEKFKPMIAAKVTELMTDEMVSRISTAAWENLITQFDKLRR